MEIEFATKLRLTAAVLGCAGRKELCARFRVVNPSTHFDLERSHKWMQGRALPRFTQVYEDWAKLLGTRRSAAWLASCTVEAFLEEICTLFDADPETLRRRVEMAERDGAPAAHTRHDRAFGYLFGTYACYSMAWSPYYRGQVLRGSLLLQPGVRANVSARYTEAIMGKTVRFTGDALIEGRTIHLLVRSPEHGGPLFIALFMPRPPASALCGIMAGATIVGPEPEPSASRMVIIRAPASADASNRYMQANPSDIADDLVALGLSLPDPVAAGTLIRDIVCGQTGQRGLDQVPAAGQNALTALLDPAYLPPGRATNTAELQPEWRGGATGHVEAARG